MFLMQKGNLLVLKPTKLMMKSRTPTFLNSNFSIQQNKTDVLGMENHSGIKILASLLLSGITITFPSLF